MKHKVKSLTCLSKTRSRKRFSEGEIPLLWDRVSLTLGMHVSSLSREVYESHAGDFTTLKVIHFFRPPGLIRIVGESSILASHAGVFTKPKLEIPKGKGVANAGPTLGKHPCPNDFVCRKQGQYSVD
ncbi:hypothetical protein MLD38_002446 [Melastoma candidum]|uniref:Uncharacterized protein n=1 Tax=Melastoma candidum TaxID=119954 RepID=A0ACB9RYU1_9MYRT|nr:hypothetical protein MLD38_002446 [Melastoma candidum]